MKIYTKFGDEGKTRLYGGDIVSKTNVRVEAYGTMDELCSLVGLIVAEIEENILNNEKVKNYVDIEDKKDLHLKRLSDVLDECKNIQQQLFNCGSDLATPRELREYKQKKEDIEWLENKIDEYLPQLPKLESFIIPGGHKISALFHQARTMTRRLERRIVAVIEENESVNSVGLKYVNRLSDYFFIVARLINVIFNVKDTIYIKSGKVFR